MRGGKDVPTGWSPRGGCRWLALKTNVGGMMLPDVLLTKESEVNGYPLLMAGHMRERDLYEVVETWAERKFGCFATAIDKGTEYGRVDVIGLRQTPGDHSAQTDLICIEVKRGTQPLLNALGQAVGYSIYGNYCYLADYRPESPYSEIEREIAEQLGIGLIRIGKNNRVEQVSNARRCQPVENFKLRLADQMGFVQCSICGTFFARSESNRNLYDWSRLQRDTSNSARKRAGIEAGKGFVFWPEDASSQDVTHQSRHSDGRLYNRRFLCNTCATLFLT